MLRSIVAVVASFFVMMVLAFALFAALWYGLGPDRLLEPGLWKGNLLFAIAVPAITIVTRLLGGWMCAKIAGAGRGHMPVMVLAGIVLALGVAMTLVTIQKSYSTDPRPPGATIDQFMDHGREPTWLSIFNALGGAAAVLVGGMLSLGDQGEGRRHH